MEEKETQHSNQILVEVVQNALEQVGLPRHAVQAITDPNRELVMQLLNGSLRGYDYSSWRRRFT